MPAVAGRQAAVPRVMTTKVALDFPRDFSYDQWERTGRQLAGLLSSSAWWLGDWLIYGKRHYSDRYERAIQACNLQYQTLRNYAWVAGRYPACQRRQGLSFQHHAEIAALDVDDRERWLQRALAERWSIRRLREAVRTARGLGTTTPAEPEEEVAGVRRLALPGERFDRWHEAADYAGVDVEQWVTATLDSAAERVLAMRPELPGGGS
ncbi:LmbU family transcriptional regulator [Mangrovihabitans endophyticus]|uniref:LmbU family transcriptional regulator n=1 Tax=Mangrovihabitans endophyticus TaxID=1751298 RepID=UPI001E444B8B|nr:LmbU family transcriptional regulator [Mangrovihabitans endophyticus]